MLGIQGLKPGRGDHQLEQPWSILAHRVKMELRFGLLESYSRRGGGTKVQYDQAWRPASRHGSPS